MQIRLQFGVFALTSLTMRERRFGSNHDHSGRKNSFLAALQSSKQSAATVLNSVKVINASKTTEKFIFGAGLHLRGCFFHEIPFNSLNLEMCRLKPGQQKHHDGWHTTLFLTFHPAERHSATNRTELKSQTTQPQMSTTSELTHNIAQCYTNSLLLLMYIYLFFSPKFVQLQLPVTLWNWKGRLTRGFSLPENLLLLLVSSNHPE